MNQDERLLESVARLPPYLPRTEVLDLADHVPAHARLAFVGLLHEVIQQATESHDTKSGVISFEIGGVSQELNARMNKLVQLIVANSGSSSHRL